MSTNKIRARKEERRTNCPVYHFSNHCCIFGYRMRMGEHIKYSLFVWQWIILGRAGLGRVVPIFNDLEMVMWLCIVWPSSYAHLLHNHNRLRFALLYRFQAASDERIHTISRNRLYNCLVFWMKIAPSLPNQLYTNEHTHTYVSPFHTHSQREITHIFLSIVHLSNFEILCA